MVWAVGDVIRVWDHQTRPPKIKRHICVCPEKQLFFRINSEPLWPPHLPLKADACDFLDHDSYVELQQLQRLHALHIQEAAKIGAINRTQMKAILLALETGGWMTEDWIEFVRDRFGF